MALLKSGSTVGGNLIWHQGILPLVPAKDELYYKDFLVFTKNNRPTNSDVGLGNVTNDAQVKKAGDTMTGNLSIVQAGDSNLFLNTAGVRANVDSQLIIHAPNQAIHIRPKGNGIADQQVVIDTAGTLSVDRVLTRSAQPGDAGSLTRKDYVDGKISAVEKTAAELANTKVAKAGDTMTGNLTAPAFLVSAGQNSAANALTRKDYVDGRANEKVAKAGDTMSGNLYAAAGVSVASSGTPGTGIYPGNADGATWDNCNFDIKSWFGIGIRSDVGNGARTIVINARSGDITSKGTLSTSVMVESEKLRVGASGIRRKTNDSALIAPDGNIGLEFTGGSHSSGFKNGYLLEQIRGFLDTKPTFKQHLQKRNLNDIRESGFYYQDANANTPGLNYPENNAGSLEVFDAAGTIQVYRVYNSSRVFQRALYSTGPWTPWVRSVNYGDGALAIGFAGTSGLGNNSIAIGDNDTGFRQVGDGILEVVANSQRVGQFTTVHAYFDKPLNIAGNTTIRDNGSFTFNKAGANPRNIRMFHAGDASRGGRLEIAGEASYIAYFEERPDNSHMTSFNSNMTVSGSSSFGAQVSVNANGPGFRLNATAATQSCYLLGQRAGANAFYVGMGGTDTTCTFHNYQTNTTMQLRPNDVYFNKLAYGAGDANFNNVYIRSDKRLKTNFKPIENAVEKVEQLSGLIYDKKNTIDGDYECREAGIIAQELQAVLPEAVSEHEGILNVSSAGVNALLINAIKELTARIKKLEGEE